MANGRECSKCGAAAVIEESAYCAFCGAELPLPMSGVEVTTERRFAALAIHPEARRAMESAKILQAAPDQPAPDQPATGAEWRLLAIVSLIVLAPLTFYLSGASLGQLPRRGLSLAMFVGGGILILVAIGVALRRLPVVATPGYRGPVPGEGDDRSKHLIRVLSTSEDVTRLGDIVMVKHLALLEWRGGERHTVEVESRELSRTLVHGDMGVATIRGGRIVAFERVNV